MTLELILTYPKVSRCMIHVVSHQSSDMVEDIPLIQRSKALACLPMTLDVPTATGAKIQFSNNAGQFVCLWSSASQAIPLGSMQRKKYWEQ